MANCPHLAAAADTVRVKEEPDSDGDGVGTPGPIEEIVKVEKGETEKQTEAKK